jgi:hypothetical protein
MLANSSSIIVISTNYTPAGNISPATCSGSINGPGLLGVSEFVRYVSAGDELRVKQIKINLKHVN